MQKAFSNVDRSSALLGLLREIDPTTAWPGYQAYGMFGTAYAFPNIGIVIGTGEDSISYNSAPLRDDDLWVTLRSPRHAEVRARLVSVVGPLPVTKEDETAWMDRFIEIATPAILCVAIKYALEKQMWRFFAEIETSHEAWYPDEEPSLRQQFNKLKEFKIDYAEQFEALLWKTFIG